MTTSLWLGWAGRGALLWLRRNVAAAKLRQQFRCVYVLVEEIRIQAADVVHADAQRVEVQVDRGGGAVGVVALDGCYHGGMLLDDARHAAGLRQRQQAIAIDLRLDALDERPDARVARDGGYRSVEGLIRLVE